MKLDMIPLLSGAKDVLTFSYTFSMDAGAETDDLPGSAETEPEDSAAMPFLFDGVEFPEPVQVEGTVVNRGGYMLLTETAVVSYETQCARCLEPIHGTVTLTAEKPVAEEKGLTSLENKDNDDYAQISDGMLDLVPPLRDEFLLSFPMRFLCKEDCAGLCAGCGANLNREVCRCQKKDVDPRFSKLAALLKDLPDDEE